MEVARKHFHAMTFHDFKVELNRAQLLQRRTSPFRDLTPSHAQCSISSLNLKWAELLKDEERSGRPSTAVIDENIATVKKMVREDPRLTNRGL